MEKMDTQKMIVHFIHGSIILLKAFFLNLDELYM